MKHALVVGLVCSLFSCARSAERGPSPDASAEEPAPIPRVGSGFASAIEAPSSSSFGVVGFVPSRSSSSSSSSLPPAPAGKKHWWIGTLWDVAPLKAMPTNGVAGYEHLSPLSRLSLERCNAIEVSDALMAKSTAKLCVMQQSYQGMSNQACAELARVESKPRLRAELEQLAEWCDWSTTEDNEGCSKNLNSNEAALCTETWMKRVMKLREAKAIR
jgi:hypothetical protein